MRLSLAKTLKNALLWDVLSFSIYSEHQFPKTSTHKGFSHRGHLSFCPLEPPFWIPHGEPPDEIGRLLRVRNLCLLYLCPQVAMPAISDHDVDTSSSETSQAMMDLIVFD